MSKKEGASKRTASDIVKARIQQLEKQLQEAFDLTMESKNKYEVLTDVLEDIKSTEKDKKKISIIEKRRKGYLEDNLKASSERDALLSKHAELTELVEILEG